MILSILRTGHHPVFQHWCVRTSMAYYRHFILPVRSSRGFASTARDQRRPVRTRFRFGCAPEGLNQAADGKSPDHYAKGTPSPSADCSAKRAPIACRRVVSGSLSSPDRGSSHLSLALLGTLSVAREYLALRDGPRGFKPASTCPVLLRCRIDPRRHVPTGLSPAVVGLSRPFGLGTRGLNTGPTTPAGHARPVWARSAFARRY
jgi:hypothetical protein